MSWWNWLLHEIGVRPNAPNGSYAFWSGPGSDIGEVAIIGGLVQIYRQHNCGVKGCLRVGRHEYEMDGAKHKLCRKHHPGIDENHAYTAQEFADHHAESKSRARATNGL